MDPRKVHRMVFSAVQKAGISTAPRHPQGEPRGCPQPPGEEEEAGEEGRPLQVCPLAGGAQGREIKNDHRLASSIVVYSLAVGRAKKLCRALRLGG